MTETNRGVVTMQHSAVDETGQGADQRADQGSGQIAVSVTDLRLKFPGEKAFVFKDVSLSVPAGEKVLLLGPSGCGKSTLLQVLGGLIPAVIDVPLKYADIRKPRSCGYVFQDPDTQFCMPYVDEELAFVLENRQVARKDMVPRMREALGRVGLDLEELHTPIERLSLGMKQRLALASVLLLEPEVLLLDEPSALLDPEGRQQIWEAVRGVSAGRTVLIVEHRIEEIVNWVDRIVLFAPDGSILADGKPAEIFTAYRRTLQENGIWYPGVWEDYIRHQDTWNSGLVQSLQQDADLAAPVLSLRGFVGLRGDAPAIMVEEAEVYAGDFVA
ncbi:ABC transporter ATP-binding protein, partial [Paenibacillus sp. AR247]|uniref:ABC transporter ATP-binding protein n=1 Tax=Paenibacillus sp. AR247 TaxID=1631599 RepID=UPI002157387A